jgi:hypothetical protein
MQTSRPWGSSARQRARGTIDFAADVSVWLSARDGVNVPPVQRLSWFAGGT